jgi:sugar-phosphatase
VAIIVHCAAALFDCDGVLVDSDASIRRSWLQWATPHGIDGVALFEASRGRRSIDSIRAIAPHLDCAVEDARFEQIEFDDAQTVTAMPGAHRLCSTPGLQWAVVSSGARRLVRARLSAAGIAAPYIVAGDELTFGKPHPEGYLRAAAHLGVAPRDCVVIEDADLGVRAGLDAGCHVLAVGPGATAIEHSRLTRLERLDDLVLAPVTP